jgi:hypothetical protein
MIVTSVVSRGSTGSSSRSASISLEKKTSKSTLGSKIFHVGVVHELAVLATSLRIIFQFQRISQRSDTNSPSCSIVRSHGNYWMRRSVTAELELEPGEYHVLMKVEAEKLSWALPVEDVVRNNAKGRRDKLLRIGLAYDLAHAKGELKLTDEEKKLQRKMEAKKKANERKEMKDKMMKDKKKRKHNDNKELRKQRAAAEKRNAKGKARAAKRAEKERVENEKREKAEKEKKENEAKSAETKPDEKKADEKNAEVVANPDTAAATLEPSATAEGSEPSEPAAAEGTTAEPTPATAEPSTTVGAKKDELIPPPAGSEGPSHLLEIRLNGSSVPPSMLDDFGDQDESDLSDIESVVSDISVGVVDDAIAEAKLAAETAAPPPNDDDDDEFQKDPWNAVAVVGLRIYTKPSNEGVEDKEAAGVKIWVVRPRLDSDGDEKAERKLDVDDPAVDATKGVDVTAMTAVTVAKEADEAGEKKEEGSLGESEGSVVVV